MASMTKSGGLIRSLWMITTAKRIDYREPSVVDLSYREGKVPRGIKPYCDVYLPASANADGSSVVLLHGGGFTLGSKSMKPMRVVATRLAEAGIAVCAVDYRLIFRGGRFAECLDDVNQACGFWIDCCSRYGADPERVSIMGLSAGAVLALMHAAHGEHRLHSVVNVYAPTDFSAIAGIRAKLILKLLHGSTDPEVLRKNSPLYAPAITAPVMTLHGTVDEIVPIAHSERFHGQRQDQKLPSEFHSFEGMHHGYLCDVGFEATNQSLQLIADFVRR